ncbi:uroporphyrinogen-III synthase [Asanoa sp. NPDC049573]|uniref:uroporphyrinogen-III synthase n=1 Tax=Asanoa sp. NPDC049573 TaxID=3155396 RepID=UPI00342AF709
MTGPLLGFTVAITAERRRDELGALLERRGARVLSAPAITIVPLLDDAALHEATAACVALAPDIVVATTGIGFRGWLEAAEGWGFGDALRGGLRGARLIARGAKPCGAIRAAGLTEHWSAPTESCAEILDKLLAEGVSGRRIAVQLHGGPQDDFTGALRAAGAEVVEVPVYRWTRREDTEPLHRLVDQVVTGQADAVCFTSAPAVRALLDASGDRAAGVLDAFRDRVLAACVGPVTAAPLRDRGVPVLVPERARLGALVRAVTDTLPSRAGHLVVAGVTVQVRGHGAVVDGEFRALAPASMALLRVLAAQPGAVVSRALLAAALPRGAEGHAVDMAVARLRSSLGVVDLVETVIKRGYRLRVTA